MRAQSRSRPPTRRSPWLAATAASQCCSSGNASRHVNSRLPSMSRKYRRSLKANGPHHRDANRGEIPIACGDIAPLQGSMCIVNLQIMRRGDGIALCDAHERRRPSLASSRLAHSHQREKRMRLAEALRENGLRALSRILAPACA